MVNGLCRLLLYERGLLYSRRYTLAHALNLDSGSARGNEGLFEMRALMRKKGSQYGRLSFFT